MDTLKAATESCLHAFALLCHEAELRDSQKTRLLEDLHDEFGRFKIWAGTLGALAKGHAALDWRLRDAHVMRSTLLSLLTQLLDTLELGQLSRLSWLESTQHLIWSQL